jgi:peptide/nickel transport system permease protein
VEHVGGRLAVEPLEPITPEVTVPVDTSGFRGAFAYFLYFTRQRPLFVLGLVIVLLSLIAAAVGPVLVPYNPTKATMDITEPPSRQHLMGTDASGYDVFSRVVAATRIDLFIALAATVISMLIGTPLGGIAGFWSSSKGIARRVSELILRLMDIIQSFPVFILALALVAVSGPSARNVIIGIAFVNIPVFLRLTRSAVLTTQHRAFVDAARVSGNSDLRIIFRHVLPNSLAPALVNASVTVGWSILLTAGLSFVGAGVRPPTPEWGAIIAQGSEQMVSGKWWISAFPGLALALTVFGYAVVGDGLRTFLDPTKRV